MTDQLGTQRHGGARPSSWRVAVAQHIGVLSRPVEWLLKLVRAAESAIPIGLLSRHEIEHVVRSAYDEAPDFYDPVTYPIRYEESLVPVLEAVMGSVNGRRLLDLYCGHGREAEIFASAGFDVLGVDVRADVIDRARKFAEDAGFEAEFLNADVETWTPSAAAWDIVYTSLWIYSTIPDRAARRAWLERLSGWVVPGGCLVISTTPRGPGVAASLRYAIASFLRIISLNPRRPELGDRFHTGLFWHDFTDATLRAEVMEAGLTIVEMLEISGGTPCTFYLLGVPTRE